HGTFFARAGQRATLSFRSTFPVVIFTREAARMTSPRRRFLTGRVPLIRMRGYSTTRLARLTCPADPPPPRPPRRCRPRPDLAPPRPQTHEADMFLSLPRQPSRARKAGLLLAALRLLLAAP